MQPEILERDAEQRADRLGRVPPVRMVWMDGVADLTLPVLITHEVQAHVADENAGLPDDDGERELVALGADRGARGLPLDCDRTSCSVFGSQ